MGDWERTYGAGVDAADIIDGYANEYRSEEEPPVFVPPDGMPKIESDLFVKLSEYTREMEPQYSMRRGDLISDWTLIQIVTLLPDTIESMKLVVGPGINDLHEFVVAVRDAKEMKFQNYVKELQRRRNNFLRSQRISSDGDD